MSNLTRDTVDLLILGVHLKHESYPNVIFRIQDIESNPALSVVEVNSPMWSPRSQGISGKRRLIRNPIKTFTAHFSVIYRFVRMRYRGKVYVPYPGVLLLFVLGLLPEKLNPEYVVLDCFISLYDTIVIDRKLFKPNSIAARIIFSMEKRVLRNANLLVVDTEQNSEYIGSVFGIEGKKILALPLSTDEKSFAPVPMPETSESCRVLFIGTLIPLHGISTIVAAMRRLKGHREIQFHIIGDGQDAPVLQAYMRECPKNARRSRGWRNSEQLAADIQASDICLGIFGNTEKSQRVCPFKIYSYSNVGRPVITARTKWARSYGEVAERCLTLVEPSNADDLAKNILALSASEEKRLLMARGSQFFYSRYLANSISLEGLKLAIGRI